MSVLSVVRDKEAIVFLKDKIRNPRFRTRTRVPSADGRIAPWVGTAFDHALRAGLAARFGGVTRQLVAEALHELPSFFLSNAKTRRNLQARLDEALQVYREIGSGGRLAPSELRACFELANFETAWRCDDLEPLERVAGHEQLDELQQLIAIIPWDDFRPERALYLNPTFGEGSYRIGGADADIVVDDAVIEAKTIKDQALSLDAVRQLVAYALLANRFGVNDEGEPVAVRRFGVYFARAGELASWQLSEAIDPAHEQPVLEFLLSQGEKHNFD